MCRFTAFIGPKQIALDTLIAKPINSLIKQSRKAREKTRELNADGFGIGWYNEALSPEPGVFRSVQPAWNDRNLDHLISKVTSRCFIGHVRAATVGEVSYFNCHPFHYKNLLFAHNGSVKGFTKFARIVCDELDDEAFSMIKGNTDSEMVFALINTFLRRQKKIDYLPAMISAYKHMMELQALHEADQFTRLNTLLTDGKVMIAGRIISDPKKESLGLFYLRSDDPIFKGGTVVSSEPLDDTYDWQELPENHFLIIDQHQNIEIRALE